MPDEEDDFEIELDDEDWEEAEVDTLHLQSKYSPGEKVVAAGSYLPGDHRAVAVVIIEKIIDWSEVNPTQKGLAYVVKHVWGDRLSMAVRKTVKRKGKKVSVSDESRYYVDKKDVHPLGKERSTNTIRKRLFPPQRRRRKKK